MLTREGKLFLAVILCLLALALAWTFTDPRPEPSAPQSDPVAVALKQDDARISSAEVKVKAVEVAVKKDDAAVAAKKKKVRVEKKKYHEALDIRNSQPLPADDIPVTVAQGSNVQAGVPVPTGEGTPAPGPKPSPSTEEIAGGASPLKEEFVGGAYIKSLEELNNVQEAEIGDLKSLVSAQTEKIDALDDKAALLQAQAKGLEEENKSLERRAYWTKVAVIAIVVIAVGGGVAIALHGVVL